MIDKNFKINKKELMLTDWDERLARLVMASNWFLKMEDSQFLGGQARLEFEEQLLIANKFIELKEKEDKRGKGKNR